MIMIVLMMRL